MLFHNFRYAFCPFQQAGDLCHPTALLQLRQDDVLGSTTRGDDEQLTASTNCADVHIFILHQKFTPAGHRLGLSLRAYEHHVYHNKKIHQHS